jgi:hypothetical protein
MMHSFPFPESERSWAASLFWPCLPISLTNDEVSRQFNVAWPVRRWVWAFVDTVATFERGDELEERTIDALQRALEAAGVEFTNGDQPGVRLTRAAAARSRESRRNVQTVGCRESSSRPSCQCAQEKTIE